MDQEFEHILALLSNLKISDDDDELITDNYIDNVPSTAPAAIIVARNPNIVTWNNDVSLPSISVKATATAKVACDNCVVLSISDDDDESLLTFSTLVYREIKWKKLNTYLSSRIFCNDTSLRRMCLCFHPHTTPISRIRMCLCAKHIANPNQFRQFCPELLMKMSIYNGNTANIKFINVTQYNCFPSLFFQPMGS